MNTEVELVSNRTVELALVRTRRVDSCDLDGAQFRAEDAGGCICVVDTGHRADGVEDDLDGLSGQEVLICRHNIGRCARDERWVFRRNRDIIGLINADGRASRDGLKGQERAAKRLAVARGQGACISSGNRTWGGPAEHESWEQQRPQEREAKNGEKRHSLRLSCADEALIDLDGRHRRTLLASRGFRSYISTSLRYRRQFMPAETTTVACRSLAL